MAQVVETPEAASVSDGVTASFTIPFTFVDGSEVQVWVLEEDGTRTLQVEDVDYAITGANGAFLTGKIPAAGSRIERLRLTAPSQPEAFGDDASFRPAANEDAFDKATRLIQEVRARTNRGLAAPVGEIGVTLPTAAARAGTVVVWNADGTSQRTDRTLTAFDADVAQTAADRLATGLDAAQTSSDRASAAGSAATAGAARDLAQQAAHEAADRGVDNGQRISLATAMADPVAAGRQTLTLTYRAPSFAEPATLVGGAVWRRATKAEIDAAGYPASAWFQHDTDRYDPDGTEDAIDGGHWLLAARVVSPYMLGAVPEVDAAAVMADVVSYLAARGGRCRMDGEGDVYLLNSAGVVVDHDNILLENAIFQRTSATTGWLMEFAKNADTSGGGVRDCEFIGLATVVGGNAGLLFGNATYRANGYVAERLTFRTFSQYGMGVAAGDDWRIDNIRVLDHGLTAGTITTCMGFWIFPRLASSGGQLSNVYSEISAACVANTSANTAAIKLQTHNQINAQNITAIFGSEEACVIDSIGGRITDMLVVPQGSNAGLAVGNYSAVHDFSGQTFILDRFEILPVSGASNVANLVVGAAPDGVYPLTGCSLLNGQGGGATYLTRSAMKDCVLKDWDFEDIRFDCVTRGFTANTAPSTNNRYVRLNVRGQGLTGLLALEASESVIDDCSAVAVADDTVSTILIRGSDNLIPMLHAANVSGNAISVIGSRNDFGRIMLGPISARSIVFASGANDNIVRAGNMSAGTGVSDSGTGNKVYGQIESGWTAGTGTANKGAFNADAIAALTFSASPTQGECEALRDACLAVARRVLSIEGAARAFGQIN